MTDIVFNDADLTRLEQLLTPLSVSGSTMRPDEAQGFFAALASGPDSVDIDMWLPEVLGDAPAFENPADLDELKALLQKLYDVTAHVLADGRDLDLILYADDDADDEEADYWPWCNAYLYALDVVDTDWFEAADDEGFEDLLMPMLVLGGMFEEEEGEDLVSFTDEEQNHFKEQLAEALVAVHRYWRAKGQAPSTVRRDGDKVGRNDVCPCGSGKKYKACCGKN
ncbi:UPF0149 family protein [uncultured Aquitalea sp.]|uniref:YecA/YgfB family protein n=1 Tax=uncultured Aquitalea sp. TaxID=540272 RepID=UPI0025E22A29|nr:UPF0149 family protein [uncultured Aquitalea sp.]